MFAQYAIEYFVKFESFSTKSLTKSIETANKMVVTLEERNAEYQKIVDYVIECGIPQSLIQPM